MNQDKPKKEVLPKELMDQMISDRKIRTAITKNNHLVFFHFYFAHYVKYATAAFQKEIIGLTENEEIKNFFIVAFRGSGKSTLITTSYPLWAILGCQEKKFVLILCHTKGQAKQHMMNLRRELESNQILKNDLGPFQEEQDEWGSGSIVFSTLNARITVASSEQSIRGLRHGAHRPDLIICDDVEDIASAKTKEGRQKTHGWLTGEVIPAGDRDTRLVVIGNLLHEDSLLMRIKRDVEEKKLKGVFKQYPIVDEEDNKILWPGKYPTLEDIESERQSVGNEIAWQREYMLKIIPAEDQIVRREWIHYYDKLPEDMKVHSIRIGVDLAISEKETADYTAMVTGWVYADMKDDTYKLYIDSIIVNKRMSFPDTLEKCKELHKALYQKRRPDFIVEDVGYQRSLPQVLSQSGLSARPMRVSSDKRGRLSIASYRIKSGQVLFPRTGCEELINQIVNFGVEKHDDLMDAFTLLILDLIDNPPLFPHIYWINTGPRFDRNSFIENFFRHYR